LTVSGLLLASGAAAQPTKAACGSYKLTKDAAISGFNHLQVKGSLQDCMKACCKMTWCHSFDWYKNGLNKCDLSMVSGDTTQLKTTYAGNPFDHYTLDRDAAGSGPDNTKLVQSLAKQIKDLEGKIGTHGITAEDLTKDVVAMAKTVEAMEGQVLTVASAVTNQTSIIDYIGRVMDQSATDMNNVQAAAKKQGDAMTAVTSTVDALRLDHDKLAKDIKAQLDSITQFQQAQPPPSAAATGVCKGKQGSCLPEVQGDKMDLELNAREGQITFSSAECASTDLCDLARKVEGILSKFQ